MIAPVCILLLCVKAFGPQLPLIRIDRMRKERSGGHTHTHTHTHSHLLLWGWKRTRPKNCWTFTHIHTTTALLHFRGNLWVKEEQIWTDPIPSHTHTHTHSHTHEQASHMWRQAGCCLWRGTVSSNCPMHAWVMSARLWKDSFPVIHTHAHTHAHTHPTSLSLMISFHTNSNQLPPPFYHFLKQIHGYLHNFDFLPLFFPLTHTQTHTFSDTLGRMCGEKKGPKDNTEIRRLLSRLCGRL